MRWWMVLALTGGCSESEEDESHQREHSMFQGLLSEIDDQADALAALDARVQALEAQAQAQPDEPIADASPAGPQCIGSADLTWTLPAEALDAEHGDRFERAVPHRGPDGDIDGFRLTGIRPGSTLDSCGIRNGDILHAVQGRKLGSMTASMEAYNELRGATSITVDIQRRGASLVHTYTLGER